ncbi:hypothetical protein [Sporisorium scitamineum]|uniref:Uncharacterized protein n=1 Tax=Sporisorium scitamineum TaxID=49012 RepID=A0A0F7S1U1_9BASI|nr:hypothetical protein [Sporisorium scitamineum]
MPTRADTKAESTSTSTAYKARSRDTIKQIEVISIVSDTSDTEITDNTNNASTSRTNSTSGPPGQPGATAVEHLVPLHYRKEEGAAAEEWSDDEVKLLLGVQITLSELYVDQFLDFPALRVRGRESVVKKLQEIHAQVIEAFDVGATTTVNTSATAPKSPSSEETRAVLESTVP